MRGHGMQMRDESSNPEDSFIAFLMKSKVKFLTYGANGITFVAQIDPSTPDSPYVSTDKASFGLSITKVLVKLLFLKNDDDVESKEVNYPNPKFAYGKEDEQENKTLDVATQTGFSNELKIQQCIYRKTNDYLDPISPAIVYANTLTNPQQIHYFFALLADRSDTAVKNMLEIMMTQLQKNYRSIGIICMEFADGYSTLNELYDEATEFNFDTTLKADGTLNFGVIKAMCMYALLELALRTCFSHGDFHFGNIMFNPSAQGYFKGLPGKPLLIDFGYTTPMAPPICQEIGNRIREGNFLLASQVMCRQDRIEADGAILKINRYPLYAWACGTKSLLTEEQYSDFYDGLFKTSDKYKALYKTHKNYKKNKGKTDEEIHESVQSTAASDKIHDELANYISLSALENDQKMTELNTLIGNLFLSRETSKAEAVQYFQTLSIQLPIEQAC
jgi:hypothetical protein